MKYLISLFTNLLFLICLSSNAQSDDVSQYFDDGGIDDRLNVVSINFSSLVVGDLALHFERKIGKAFGLETNLGLLLPYYTNEIPRFIFDYDKLITDPQIGYSFSLFPKFYLQDKFDGIFLGLQYRRRSYLMDSGNIHFNDISYLSGSYFDFSSRLILEYAFGIGYRFVNSDGENEILFPFLIKLGYIFNYEKVNNLTNSLSELKLP